MYYANYFISNTQNITSKVTVLPYHSYLIFGAAHIYWGMPLAGKLPQTYYTIISAWRNDNHQTNKGEKFYDY